MEESQLLQYPPYTRLERSESEVCAAGLQGLLRHTGQGLSRPHVPYNEGMYKGSPFFCFHRTIDLAQNT